MKRPLRALTIAAVLTAAAAPKLWPALEPAWSGALTALAGGSAPRTDVATRAAQSERPTRVGAILIRASPLAEIVSSTGTLLAVEGVELQAEVSGKIVAIEFGEGARVRKGDLLVKLNDADLQAMRLAATHELSLARSRERRAAELLVQRFVMQDEYDAALNAVQLSEAKIALTDAQIAKTEIRAPFDGVAGLRYVSEGAFVGATTRIATLQRIDSLKVDFAVPEKYADRIRVGSSIAFTVAGREREFVGEVYAYDPKIDAETRTLLIRALCPNPGGVLLPGAFANVKLTVSELRDALLIPAEALIPDYEAAHVFVARDGKVERRRVVAGIRTEARVQIVSGLHAGEVVVTSGVQQIGDGSRVEVELTDAALSSAATSY